MKKLIIYCFLCWFACPVFAIEFTVHHAPGGPSDRVTRLIAQQLPNYTVVNRPGAAARIAMRSLAQKPSVMLATMPQIWVANRQLFAAENYDPDALLSIIAVVAEMPNIVLCHKNTGITTWDQLTAHRTSLTWAVAGLGSSEHMATAYLLSQWPNQHIIVPFAQGGSQSSTALLAHQIDCQFANAPTAVPLLNHTAVTPLLATVSNGLWPRVPQWTSQFKRPWPITAQLALVISRDTAVSDQQVIRADMTRALAHPQLAQQLSQMGLTPVLSTQAHDLADAQALQHQQYKWFAQQQFKLN